MILTPIQQYKTMILILLTLMFSNKILTKTHTTTTNQKSHLTKTNNKQINNKQKYSHNNTKNNSLPNLQKYPSKTPKKKTFLQTIIPYITNQNTTITTKHN